MKHLIVKVNAIILIFAICIIMTGCNANKKQSDYKLGIEALEQGDYDDALTYIQMALSLEGDKDEQLLRRNEILAYENKKDFASAKTKMESYVADYPDDAAAAREYQFLQTR